VRTAISTSLSVHQVFVIFSTTPTTFCFVMLAIYMRQLSQFGFNNLSIHIGFNLHSIDLVNSLYKFDVGFASSTVRAPSDTAQEEPGRWNPSHPCMRFVLHDILIYFIIESSFPYVIPICNL